MKHLNIIFFVLVILVSFIPFAYGQNNTLLGKTWAYKKVSIIYQQDTLEMFNSDSVNNVWYLGKVTFAFKANNIYNGTTTEGYSQAGSWSLPDIKTIVVDRDTNNIEEVNESYIVLSGRIKYSDDSISVEGILQTILYVVPPIISSCESLQSGDWSTATTWSCGHAPTSADLVIINNNHTVTISTNAAEAQRVIYNGGTIQFTSSGAKIFIKGSD